MLASLDPALFPNKLDEKEQTLKDFCISFTQKYFFDKDFDQLSNKDLLTNILETLDYEQKKHIIDNFSESVAKKIDDDEIENKLKELFGVVNPNINIDKKSDFFCSLKDKTFKAFNELKKNLILTSENELRDRSISDFTLGRLLNDNPSFFDKFDCFEIKKILKELNFAKIYFNPNDIESKVKLDKFNHLIALTIYELVKRSSSFQLIDSDKSLKEEDFEASRLSLIKKQFKINENLDQENLMKLYFALKFLGQESNFISAIKPDKIKENLHLNYQLKLSYDDLPFIHVLRSLDKLSQRDLALKTFDKIKDGKKHICTSFFYKNFGIIDNDKLYDSFLIDPNPVSAMHFSSDIWSEDFSYPRFREYRGEDTESFRAHGEGRHFITYHFHALLNPEAHKHHFEHLGKCKTICMSILYPQLILPPELITNIEGSQDPRIIQKSMLNHYIFDNKQLRDEVLVGQGDRIMREELPDVYKSNVFYNESNIYLNFSDISGLVKTGKSSYDFIDLFCETENQRKQTQEVPERFDEEISKIQWQRQNFCVSAKNILEKKLKTLSADLEKLKSDSAPNRSQILCKYSSAVIGDAWTPCCGPSTQIYDQEQKRLSMFDRLNLVNPDNINLSLQKEIWKTRNEINYLEHISQMPSEDEVRGKLLRKLEFYDYGKTITNLTKILDLDEEKPDFKKLFAVNSSSLEDFKLTKNKFIILIERLAIDGFYIDDDGIGAELNQKRLQIKNELDEIATNLGVNIQDIIQIGLDKTVPEKLSQPLPNFEPFKYIPLDYKTSHDRDLPAQLSMTTIQDRARIGVDENLSFKLSEREIKDLLSSYRLKYDDAQRQSYSSIAKSSGDKNNSSYQSYYNTAFNLYISDSASLEGRINHAFENLNHLIFQYDDNCKRSLRYREGRDIHDGFHALTTASYAKELFKFYQTNIDYFPDELKTQIREFDNEKKVRDLEILCIMHDTARTHGFHDQDEYKNAFYVALKLRAMGDERFQGAKISEEGLKLIMDLANKESKDQNKSLMSKLIQSSDSLAILRCPEFCNKSLEYKFEMNDVFKDLSKISDDQARAKETSRLMKIGNMLLENEIKHKPPTFLEYSETPLQDYFKSQKSRKLLELFKDETTPTPGDRGLHRPSATSSVGTIGNALGD